jgi:hypothetical protein
VLFDRRRRGQALQGLDVGYTKGSPFDQS